MICMKGKEKKKDALQSKKSQAAKQESFHAELL